MAPIKIGGYTLNHVYTYKGGTVVEFRRPIQPSKLFTFSSKLGERRINKVFRMARGKAYEKLVFIDNDNNGRLSAGDVVVTKRKWVTKYFNMSMPPRARKISRKHRATFGRLVNRIFKLARNERTQMKKSIPAQSKGRCVVYPGSTSSGIMKLFSPPFKINMKRTYATSRYTQDQIKRARAIDPRKCPQVRIPMKLAITRTVRRRSSTVYRNITITTGELLGPIDAKILSNYFLSNDSNYADVTYSSGQYMITHVDIAK